MLASEGSKGKITTCVGDSDSAFGIDIHHLIRCNASWRDLVALSGSRRSAPAGLPSWLARLCRFLLVLIKCFLRPKRRSVGRLFYSNSIENLSQGADLVRAQRRIEELSHLHGILNLRLKLSGLGSRC